MIFIPSQIAMYTQHNSQRSSKGKQKQKQKQSSSSNQIDLGKRHPVPIQTKANQTKQATTTTKQQ